MTSNELLGPEDEVDSDGGAPVLALPKMTVTVVSNDVMQVTISKTLLDVFKSLGQVCGFRCFSSVGVPIRRVS